MKKHILLYISILGILLSSCSSIKDDYKAKSNALNDFLKKEIKDTINSIVIVKQKLNSNETIAKIQRGYNTVY